MRSFAFFPLAITLAPGNRNICGGLKATVTCSRNQRFNKSLTIGAPWLHISVDHGRILGHERGVCVAFR